MNINLRKIIVEPVEKGIEHYAEAGARNLNGFASIMFGCFVSIWVVYKVYDGLIKGDIDFIEMGRRWCFSPLWLFV